MPASEIPQRRTQASRTRETTASLLAAARELFAADGYAATSLDSVVAAAGVTKGALYHHFGGKRELFAAVYEREQERLAEVMVAAYSRKKDPAAAFDAGCRAFFEASLDPAVQRITLLDAPVALGWEAMHEIEERYSLALLRAGIQEAIDAGQLRRRPVDALASLLFGATCEAVMVTARADDPQAATRAFLKELRVIVDALLAG